MTTYSIAELQRAVSALETGEFRQGRRGDTGRGLRSAERWHTPERVIAVLGAGGRVGATTVAVAVADLVGDGARVVEAAPMHATGLAAASSAELGVNEHGWRQGFRGEILLERTGAFVNGPSAVPIPTTSAHSLTVVDVGWDIGQVMADSSWIRDVIMRVPLLIVTVATAPGVRALDTALHLSGRSDAGVSAFVLGPPRKRWPAVASIALAGKALELDRAGRVRAFPLDRRLAAAGITGDPLPAHLVRAVQPIVTGLTGADLERDLS